MRYKQYLYYREYWWKLLVQSLGMASFLIFNMVHVLLGIQTSRKDQEEDTSTLKSTYLFYTGFEIIACTIFVMAKITYDLFVEFNRDKSILQISIFQKEKYLKGVDRKFYKMISTDGDHKLFRESLDNAIRKSVFA